jgi:Maleate cis-trans isomerase
VLSACVQLPSLDVLDEVQHALGKPVLSAAAATTHRMLRALGLRAEAPRGGALLGGAYALADPPEAVLT